jgi:hypothetical protein
MMAARSPLVSSSSFFRRNERQCHSQDGKVLSKTHREHEAYGLEGAEAVLEAAAEEREHAAGLAVEAAPEAGDLRAPGVRLGQPHRRLDGLGAAAVELGPVEVAGGEVGDQPDERGAVFRGEAPDVQAGHLPLHGRHVFGMGVPEAGDAHAREQVDVALAVHVVEQGAFAPVHAQAAEQGHALGAGGKMLSLGLEQGRRTRPRNLLDQVRHGHAATPT